METICWNVDTQRDFMRKEGGLYVPQAESIEQALAYLTGLAKKHNRRTINTADGHDALSEEISANPDYLKTFPAHCISGTEGAQFVPATLPEKAYIADWREGLEERAARAQRNIVLTKDAADVFSPKGSPHVERLLELISPDRVIVYGVASNICVDFAVNGLLERRIQEVYVVRDAIMGLPNLPNPIPKWEARGVKMISAREAEQYLKR